MKQKRKTKYGKRVSNLERRVIAVELPLRMRAANLGGIAARNEKLNALQASALRNDLHRVEQIMDSMKGFPAMQKAPVAFAAQQLKKDLAKLAGR